jgi:hypothetical protein
LDPITSSLLISITSLAGIQMKRQKTPELYRAPRLQTTEG